MREIVRRALLLSTLVAVMSTALLALGAYGGGFLIPRGAYRTSARPACDYNTHGQIWFSLGSSPAALLGAGTVNYGNSFSKNSDSVQVCAVSNTNAVTLAWRPLLMGSASLAQ